MNIPQSAIQAFEPHGIPTLQISYHVIMDIIWHQLDEFWNDFVTAENPYDWDELSMGESLCALAKSCGAEDATYDIQYYLHDSRLVTIHITIFHGPRYDNRHYQYRFKIGERDVPQGSIV